MTLMTLTLIHTLTMLKVQSSMLVEIMFVFVYVPLSLTGGIPQSITKQLWAGNMQIYVVKMAEGQKGKH